MADPLTLHWNCGRTCTALACYCEANINYQVTGTVGGIGSVQWVWPTGTKLFDTSTANGFHSTSCSTDILIPANWLNLVLNFGLNASLLQPYDANPAIWTVSAWVRIDYGCVDPLTGAPVKSMSVHAAPIDTAYAECRTGPDPTDFRSWAQWAGGGGTAKIFRSSPLGACNGSNVTVGFGPVPDYSVPPGNTQCLCASGGTPPYGPYTVDSGSLAPGQTLDPDSGCLVGAGTPPGPVTFSVPDSGGGHATLQVPFGPAVPGPNPIIPAQFSLPVNLPDPTRGPCQ